MEPLDINRQNCLYLIRKRYNIENQKEKRGLHLKTIYYIRHGQTEMNRKNLVQGRINSDLTALGQMQAYTTGQFFMDEQIHFDSAYSSPALRARNTAMLICPYLKAVPVDDFDETAYGELEGASHDVFQKHASNQFKDIKGVESVSEVKKRVKQGLEMVLSDTGPDETILIVGHGSSGFRLASVIDPERAKKMRKFGNCLIYKYTAESSIDSVHLESIELGPASLLDETKYL